jgi:hypothetical protein
MYYLQMSSIDLDEKEVMQARCIMETFVSSHPEFNVSFTLDNGLRYSIHADKCQDGLVIIMNVFGGKEPFGFMKYSGSVKGPFYLH